MNAPEMGGEGGCSNGGGDGGGSRGCGDGSSGGSSSSSSSSSSSGSSKNTDNNNNYYYYNYIQYRTGRHYVETILGFPRLLRTQWVPGLLFPHWQ